MFSNLLLVAVRNLRRDLGYNILNIFGLMIGITFSILLIFYIRDELSYDRHHDKSERIHRINSFIQEPDKPMMKWAISQYPLGPTLKKDYPEVEQSVRFVGKGRTMYKYGNLKFYEDKIYFTDSSIFKIFTHPFIDGDPNTALVAPNSIILTKSVAEKYFGKATGAVGKTLQDDNGEAFRVTGVIKDVPQHSHIRFNILISATTLPKDFGNNWGNFNYYTYVLLKPNVTPASFEKKLGVMYDKYMASIFDQFNVKIHYGIQKITDIHLRSEMTNEPEELGSMSYIYIFSAIVVFMLLIACINYMNLTTARSARRAKEIGIRKTTGSSRFQLITQFLAESTLTSVIALILSIGLVAVFLPLFNQVSGKQITYVSMLEPGTILILLLIVIFVGFVGGSYPAFYLSNLQPVNILKGNVTGQSANVVLRRVLVVIQFSISLVMLICTWVVDRQLRYLQSRDLGFNKEQVLSVPVNANRDMRSSIVAFENALSKNANVRSVSTAQSTPGGGNVSFNLFSVESTKGYTDQGVDCYAVDENYFSTLGINITKGRNFSGLSDTLRSIIVNENMVKYFKWDEPIGKKVKFAGDTSSFYLEVVGVVKDFNQKSLYNPIAPLLMFYRPNNNNIQVKLQPANIKTAISDIERTWKTVFPDLEFSYSFLDEDFNAQYAADQRRGKIYAALSVLTILITCLGLLGLIAFTTQQRQKEISIRKVLGAGLPQLVPLITKSFVILVGISCLVAFPVAYVFMYQWLKIFPYNTGMSVLPFIFSAIVILGLTMLTVIFHTVKAAMANPARKLRSE